jgi:hypothetical protein
VPFEICRVTDGTTGLQSPRLAADSKAILACGSFMALIAGIQLFLGTEATDRYFAWTIQPPITAAFLGAAYLSAVVLLLSAALERRWAEARLATYSGFALITLVLVATLIHLDRFHTDSDSALTLAGTWAFVATYVVLPPAFAWVIVRQARVAGAEPPRRVPLPRWARGYVAVQGAVLLGIGSALVVAPTWAAAVWPWELTPLTGRATGAWTFAIGLALLLGLYENDWIRLRVPLRTYTALAVLELVALLRYAGSLDWGAAQSWVYVAFLAGMLAFAAYGLRAVRRASAAEPGASPAVA